MTAWTRPRLLGRAALWLGFGLAYGQFPFGHGTQNTYALRAVATLDPTRLDRDWLVGTQDPVPAFTWLLTFLLRWGPWTTYLLHGVLVAAGIASLSHIARAMLGLDRRQTWLLGGLIAITMSGLTASAGGKLLGSDLRHLLWAGLAEQSVFGPVFQPALFGVLLLAAIALWLAHRHGFAMVCLVAATVIHRVYLLPAGFIWLGFAWLTHIERPAGRPRLWLAIGLSVLAVVAVVVATEFAPASAEQAEQGADILVNQRFPHHARIARWWSTIHAGQLALLAAGVILARRCKAVVILLIAATLAAGLLALAELSDSNVLRLLLPVRVSTVLIPIACALILARAVASPAVAQQLARVRSPHFAVLRASLAAMLAAGGWMQLAVRTRAAAASDEALLASALAERWTPAAVALIPPQLESIRLRARIPIVVDFKSHPYKADQVMAWAERYARVRRFYDAPDAHRCIALPELVRRYGVTLVVTAATSPLRCPGLATPRPGGAVGDLGSDRAPVTVGRRRRRPSTERQVAWSSRLCRSRYGTAHHEGAFVQGPRSP